MDCTYLLHGLDQAGHGGLCAASLVDPRCHEVLRTVIVRAQAGGGFGAAAGIQIISGSERGMHDAHHFSTVIRINLPSQGVVHRTDT